MIILPADASPQTVNYTVQAINGIITNTVTTSSYDSVDLNTVKGSGRVRSQNGAASNVGYVVTIPANNQSGYLITAGFFPARRLSGSSTTAWATVNNGNLGIVATTNYVLSSSFITPYANVVQADSYHGYIYIPAHTQPLYLYVFEYVSGSNGEGALALSNAFINFIPESSGGSDTTNQILQQVQNIYQSLQSSTEQNNVSSELLQQMNETLAEINDLVNIINQNTNRPNSGDVLPSLLPTITDKSDVGVQDFYSAMGSFMENQIILTLMLVAATMMLVRYVFFGKSGGG